MNIIKSGSGLSVTIKLPVLLWLPQTITEKFRILPGTTVMGPSIQVYVQVALLCCVVTTSMGGNTDLQKAFSQLENKVNVQQEEIKSLYWLIEQLEKRLEPLETNGEFGEVQIQPAVPTPHTCCHDQNYHPIYIEYKVTTSIDITQY